MLTALVPFAENERSGTETAFRGGTQLEGFHLPTVSVVIPTLNAAPYLAGLLDALFSQLPQAPAEVVLVDSLSTDTTAGIAASDQRVRVVPIANFSHGRARNIGAREAQGEIVVLLTQDALPAGSAWLAHLLAPFEDPQVVAT